MSSPFSPSNSSTPHEQGALAIRMSVILFLPPFACGLVKDAGTGDHKGQYRSNTCKSQEEAVGEPGEGKPRPSMSGTTGRASDMEWRGLPPPGFLAIIHQLFSLLSLD